MARLEVTVGNRPYHISCAPEEMERVRALAAEIDRQLAVFQRQNPGAGQSQLILMAALTVLDDARTAAETALARLVAVEERITALQAKVLP
ncbi:MAG: cell division protein ZapA [Rhodospirillales bacterium]|nr:cell division protein ZapA [Rhodospirillales bacterium]